MSDETHDDDAADAAADASADESGESPPAAPPMHKFPKWAPQAGVAFLAVTVVFLMVLVIASVVFQKPINDSTHFLVVAILALTVSAGGAFLGGSAAADGKLNIPGASSHPVRYSLGGGAAMFAIVLTLGMQLAPTAAAKADEPGEDEPIITDTIALAGPETTAARAPEPPAATPQSGEPSWTTVPTYATVGLNAGFQPDPYMHVVRAGGALYVEVGDQAQCRGWIHPTAPDVNLDYQAGGYPLTIHARGDVDLVLVVRAPDGQWYCNDDYADSNPLILFTPASSGRYHIWVGTYQQPSAPFPEAAVLISESTPGA